MNGLGGIGEKSKILGFGRTRAVELRFGCSRAQNDRKWEGKCPAVVGGGGSD